MLSTHTHKVKITQGQAAHSHRSRKKKQWSTAMIMHQICLHHISSLLWRKNTQLLICPTASFSLCLSLTHSPILSFIPAFTSLFFFYFSLTLRNLQTEHDFFFSEMDPSSKQDHKHAGAASKLSPQTPNSLTRAYTNKHTQEVDTILKTPAQSNAIQYCSPAIHTALVKLLL